MMSLDKQLGPQGIGYNQELWRQLPIKLIQNPNRMIIQVVAFIMSTKCSSKTQTHDYSSSGIHSVQNAFIYYIQNPNPWLFK